MRPSELLALQNIPGVGNKTLIALIKYCQLHGVESLEQLKSHDASNALRLKASSKKIEEFLSGNNLESVVREIEEKLSDWKSKSVFAVPFGSADYPDQLGELNDPPAFLFCRGDMSLLKAYKSIAVVGTRHNTPLGEVIARKTVEFFTQKGFCIVSGLAFGIDAIAHRAALEHRGKTVAVLVDVTNVSPSQNRTLAEQIVESGGLLVAENPPGSKVIPALFAKRDRIQSGLSLAVFAVETAIDGGTMHAVRAAGELGRPVFVPDPVAARYPDLAEPAISGTQWLVNQDRAEKYCRESYDQMVQRLESLAAKLEGDPGASRGPL